MPQFLGRVVAATVIVVAVLSGLVSIFAFFGPAKELLVSIAIDPIRAEIEVAVEEISGVSLDILRDLLLQLLELLRPVIERCRELGDRCFGQ